MIKEEQRDRAQGECWSKTVKATSELFGWNNTKTARHLLDLPKERLMEYFKLYAPHWAKVLEENGGIK